MTERESGDDRLHLKSKRVTLQGKLLVAAALSFIVGIAAFVEVAVYTTEVIPGSSIGTYRFIPIVCILMGIGLTLSFCAVTGFVASRKENLLLLRWNRSIALVLSILTALTFGYLSVSSLFHRENAKNIIERAITNYHENEQLKESIDILQVKYECCGIRGPTDWNLNEHFFCNATNHHPERCNIPVSCCVCNETALHFWVCGKNGLNLINYQQKINGNIIYKKGCGEILDRIMLKTMVILLMVLYFMWICQIVLYKLLNGIISIKETLTENDETNSSTNYVIADLHAEL